MAERGLGAVWPVWLAREAGRAWAVRWEERRTGSDRPGPVGHGEPSWFVSLKFGRIGFGFRKVFCWVQLVVFEINLNRCLKSRFVGIILW